VGRVIAVATPRTATSARHLFTLPFAKEAYDYGYSITLSTHIYEEESTSVSEARDWYLLTYGQIEPLLRSDDRIQFQGRN